MTLHIRQYVYFTVQSSGVTAAEMTAAIGLDPDEVSVRASRRADPPVPQQHEWQVRCQDPGLRIDDQIEQVIGRLRPHAKPLRDLIDRLRAEEGETAGATLWIVRYLDDENGEGDGWQHRLLGWRLRQDTLRFVLTMGAEIVADEYGQDEPEEARARG